MKGRLDAIYWRLHTYYLRNEREDALRFLKLFEDEDKKTPKVFDIDEIHRGRFKKIKEGILNGSFSRLYGSGTSVSNLDFSYINSEKSGKEKDFCWELIKADGLEKLCDIIGCTYLFTNVVSELNMDPYGRCDLVLKEGRSMYVVEVKMGSAPSSVVSQIDKYRLCMELDMCRGLYDEVFAFVLAENYPSYVSLELSRLDVGMIEHKGSPDTLKKIS